MKNSFLFSIVLIFSVMISLGGCLGPSTPDSTYTPTTLEKPDLEKMQQDALRNYQPKINNTGTNTTGATTTSFSIDETDERPAGEAQQIFLIGNDGGVANGGTPPTFTLDSAYWITEIWTYHWNNGQGAPSVGNITVQSADGQTYGPFQCEGRSTNNVYWVANLNQTLPVGNYTIIDSDPNTLAQNAATKGQGHAWAYGIKK